MRGTKLVEHRLTLAQARRVAICAQLLSADRGCELFEVIEHLDGVGYDQTNVVAPSADLVLFTRLGSAYSLGEVGDLLASQQLIEIDGTIRVPEDVALFSAQMAAWPAPGRGRDGQLDEWQRSVIAWVADNDQARRDILDALRADGPLPTADLPDTVVRPWRSSGWNNNKTTAMLLMLMVRRGEVAPAGREGRTQMWDLAERIYPAHDPVPLTEALLGQAERQLTALGIARTSRVGKAGEAARIEGVSGTWRVSPEALARSAGFVGRTAVLSPLDRLVFDRSRTSQLFEFDYQLEMYKPKANRRWGYWAMPILVGDRLVGKVDATAERAEGVLRVDAIHQDRPFTAKVRAGVDNELSALADWLGLEVYHP